MTTEALDVELDLDALEAAARKHIVASDKLRELDAGIGGLAAKRPQLAEDLRAWLSIDRNDHADIVLALIERVRSAETELLELGERQS